MKITGYFFRIFLWQGLIFFAVLTAIFASCNLFARLPVIQNVLAIPELTLMMLPLMALFSLPIASGLAVYMTLAQHKIRDELLLLAYVKDARWALHKAVLLFAFVCGAIYVMLVFQVAPQSYKLGKQLIVKVAKEHFLQLEPNKFHTPFAGLTFFYKTKVKAPRQTPKYTTIFLVYAPNNQERYFFTAQDGCFISNLLKLHNGSMHTIKSGRFHAANFQEMEIDFRSLLMHEDTEHQFSNIKYTTWQSLFNLKDQDQDALVELHKRVAQSLWQLLFPFLAFCGALMLRRYSLLAGIVLCGSFYLFSYITLALGQFFGDRLPLALALFYVPQILLLFGIIGVRRRYSN